MCFWSILVNEYWLRWQCVYRAIAFRWGRLLGHGTEVGHTALLVCLTVLLGSTVNLLVRLTPWLVRFGLAIDRARAM